MNKIQPLITVVLPVFNNQKHLASCLKSILTQTYKNIEIIATDDHSKDKSFQIIQQFKKQDKRIHVSKNKKRYGLAICFNRSLRKAKGNFIVFADPNSILNKQKLENQVEYLLFHSKTVAVGTQCSYGNKNNQLKTSDFPTENELILKTLIPGLSMQFETAMINKRIIPKDILKFDSNHVFPFIYSEVFMRLSQYGELANLTEDLSRHRIDSADDSPSGINLNQLFPTIKLALKSIALYDHRPSLRSLLSPLVKQI